MIRIINEVDFSRLDDYDFGPSWETDLYEEFAAMVQKKDVEEATYEIVDDKENCIKVRLPFDCELYGKYLIWEEDKVCKEVADFLKCYKRNITDISLEYYAKSTDPEMVDIVTSETLDNYEKYNLITEKILNILYRRSKEDCEQIHENWESYFSYLFFAANWAYFKQFNGVFYYWRGLYDE